MISSGSCTGTAGKFGTSNKDSRRRNKDQSEIRRSRNALATTLTDDNDIAAAAIAGDSMSPNNG